MNKTKISITSAAFLYAICMSLGLLVLMFFIPDLHIDNAIRLQAIHEYGIFMLLWYFVVWILPGICVIVLTYSLFKLSVQQHGRYENAIMLMSFAAASYFFSIGIIEITSAYKALINQQENLSEVESLYIDLSVLLRKIRRSTEFANDIWLFMLSLWLFIYNSVSRFLSVFGMFVGVMGILVLLPALAFLGLTFVFLSISWFALFGFAILKTKDLQISKPSLNK